MRLASEIVSAIIDQVDPDDYWIDGKRMIPILESIIAAKLEPVFEASRDASTALWIALQEMSVNGIPPSFLLDEAVKSVRENNVRLDLLSEEE